MTFSTINYILSFCNKSYIVQIMLIVKTIFKIACYLAPVLVIIASMIHIFKIVMSGKEDDFKEALKITVKRIIAGLLIAFLPALTNYVFTLVNASEVDFLACFESASKEKVNSLKEKEAKEAEAEKEKQKQDNEAKLREAYEAEQKQKGAKKQSYEEWKKNNNRSSLSKEGNSEIKAVSKGDDRYEITVGGVTYQVIGQNESSFASATLRDGRSFSNGGCGPTALTTALSSFGYTGNPVEVNQAGSDVSVESHVKAIKTLQASGKLSPNVKVDSHPKSSLPNNADDFYNEVRDALTKGHAVVMDIREGSKQGNNFCNIYGTGDYFENEGAVHAHWTTIAAYDPKNDNAFFANSCGERKWAPLRNIMDLTYEAVSGKVFNDESGWVGSWVDIYN